jgi:tetratricopeptide (TPR) repeat protein
MSRIEELEKRLAADPGSRMFVQLAEEYRKAGLLEQAIDCCEKGLKKHPQYPSARVALGRALLEAGELDRARDELEAVLKQAPDNILAYKFLGETYQKLGRLEDALKKFQIAATLAPEDNEIGEHIQQVQAELAGGARPVPAPAVPAPAPVPGAPAPPRPAEDGEATEVERTARRVDLPPIPLVEVNEPMELVTSDYVPPPKAPSAPAPPPPRVVPPAPSFAEPALLEPTLAEAPRVAPRPPAPPAAKPAPAPAPVSEIETPTMAEIYASQGHFDQALAVYRRIVERHPQETQYRERIEELLMLARAAGEPARPAAAGHPAAGGYDADERTIQVLEAWLAEIQKSRGA